MAKSRRTSEDYEQPGGFTGKEDYRQQGIQSSFDIFQLLQSILRRCSKRDRAREHFWILCLGPGQTVCHLELLALGTQNKVLIDPREVYSLALQQNASSIVAIHNHPSGQLKPSPADKSITQQLLKGSELVNLRLLDHLIISEESYSAFWMKDYSTY